MRCHVAGQEYQNGHMGGSSSWVEFQQTAGGQFKMLRPLVVLLRWRDRPRARLAGWQKRRRHRPPRNERDLLIGKHAAATDRPAAQLRATTTSSRHRPPPPPQTAPQRNYFSTGDAPRNARAADWQRHHHSPAGRTQKQRRPFKGRGHSQRPELLALGLARNAPRRRPWNRSYSATFFCRPGFPWFVRLSQRIYQLR